MASTSERWRSGALAADLGHIGHSLVTHLQVASAKAGQQVHAPKGASGSTEAHLFGWRDAMDIIVRWRQLSEPNDQASIHPTTCSATLT